MGRFSFSSIKPITSRSNTVKPTRSTSHSDPHPHPTKEDKGRHTPEEHELRRASKEPHETMKTEEKPSKMRRLKDATKSTISTVADAAVPLSKAAAIGYGAHELNKKIDGLGNYFRGGIDDTLKGLDNLGHKIGDHMPNSSNISDALNAVQGPVSTGITIAVVLGSVVLAYEAYRFLTK